MYYFCDKTMCGGKMLAKWILTGISVFFTTTALAAAGDENSYLDDAIKRYQTRGSIIKLDDSAFGDQVSLNNGALSIVVTDVDIPGNNNLPVRFSRKFEGNSYDSRSPKYEMQQWRIDVPYITTKLTENLVGSWWQGKECSGAKNPGIAGKSGVVFEPYQFWNGVSLYVPGEVNEQILDNSSYVASSSKYPSITKSNWLISCVSNGSSGEAFVVKSPNGTKYTFSKRKLIPTLGILASKGSNYFTLERFDAYMLITKIEDLNGNYVDYNYNSNADLTSIVSNDNRAITVNYSSDGKVSTVVANGKTWTYTYSNQTGELSKSTWPALSKVTLPDSTYWEYHIVDLAHFPNKAGSNCAPANTSSLKTKGMVKHPSGAIANYYLQPISFYRSDIPFSKVSAAVQFKLASECARMYSIIKKEISGPALGSNLVWEYSYSQNWANYNIMPAAELPAGINNLSHARTTVLSPDNKKSVYYFDRSFISPYENMNKVVETYDRSTNALLERITKNYSTGQVIGTVDYKFPQSSFYWENMSSLETRQNKVEDTTERFYGASSDTYTVQYNGFDKYGLHAAKVERNNFSSHQLHESYTYYSDTNNWVIGLPSVISRSSDGYSWKEYKKFDYNSTGNGISKVKNLSLNGRLIYSYSYDSLGNLYEKTFNGTNRFERFENYYRGTPRRITLPCSVTNNCNSVNSGTSNTIVFLQEVNDDGTIASTTDFNGNKVSYRYNIAGWLQAVDYQQSLWNDKNFSYTYVNVSEDGISGSNIPVGSLRQTLTHGDYIKHIYHDAFYRPIFVVESDRSDSSTRKYISYTYDAAGHQTLESFPSGSASNRTGIVLNYDSLGRIISQNRTSDGANVIKEYLPGNKVHVTDAERNSTTTTFLSFGFPQYNNPVKIEIADSGDTLIQYNEFEKVLSISQGSVVENRLYNSFQDLCKVVRPETGAAVYMYDTQGRNIWFAEGVSGSSSSCDESSVPTSQRILLSYDNLNQIREINYPDQSPDKQLFYDQNGNQTKLVSGGVVWDYEYNGLNLVEKETLSLDSKTFIFDWGYNGMGYPSQLTYPSGILVDFLPNALGQPTKAGMFAYNAKYHPNGQLRQVTYGNGIIRNITQDTSGRTDLLTDKFGSATRISLDADYYLNDNLSQLLSLHDRNYDVSGLAYDSSDRLTSANGIWGTGRLSYDGLGNVLTKTINNSTMNYVYNSRNLLSETNGANLRTFAYDARGNVSNNSLYNLVFNSAGQLASAKSINYLYDGHNRKVKKSSSSGNSYTAYSKDGLLLYRELPNGKKTESIYLSGQIIAEFDTPSNVPQDVPNIILAVKEQANGECPKLQVCEIIISNKKHLVEWNTAHASSCSGLIRETNGGIQISTQMIIGASGSVLLTKNSSNYAISLTCNGPGGSATVTANALPAGSSDM